MFVADLLRHGALAGGVKYRGRIEADLTTEGQNQMNHVWERLRNNINVIISSPLSRCALPAQQWAEEKGIPCIIEPRIAEMHYGEWEGLTHEKIKERFPNMLAQWRNDPTGMRPPQGESPEELQSRIVDFWQDACQRYRGKHALIVAHSGSIRMLIAHIQNQSIAYTRQIAMPYACWSRAEDHAGKSNMIFTNAEQNSLQVCS
ncbi:MAG: histidine phosphatase family protein [Mariprofundaceae bacterium]|nr:histidine phosphatase family protein [Mariprofundaceae bacterium]